MGTNLQRELDEQRRFLQRSCDAVDTGDVAEAVRIATTVRVLCYEGGRGDSLLKQLGVKDSITWRGSRNLPEGHYGFVLFAAQGGTSNVEAHLDETGHTDMNFKEWWTGPVYKAGGETVSRGGITLMLAHNDGGAHVELSNPKRVKMISAGPQIIRVDAFGVETTSQSENEEYSQALLRLQMRTIGAEMLATLRAV